MAREGDPVTAKYADMVDVSIYVLKQKKMIQCSLAIYSDYIKLKSESHLCFTEDNVCVWGGGFVYIWSVDDK